MSKYLTFIFSPCHILWAGRMTAQPWAISAPAGALLWRQDLAAGAGWTPWPRAGQMVGRNYYAARRCRVLCVGGRSIRFWIYTCVSHHGPVLWLFGRWWGSAVSAVSICKDYLAGPSTGAVNRGHQPRLSTGAVSPGPGAAAKPSRGRGFTQTPPPPRLPARCRRA